MSPPTTFYVGGQWSFANITRSRALPVWFRFGASGAQFLILPGGRHTLGESPGERLPATSAPLWAVLALPAH